MTFSQLRSFFYAIHSSFWFWPAAMVAGAIALALGGVRLDERIQGTDLGRLISIHDPAGARELLSTISGAIITVAGVVFSITTVSLVLAASQFGSRILQNYIRNTANQLVLGTFLATFTYALLVMRAVRQGDMPFVPQLSVLIGIGFAIASLGVLTFFVHHIAVFLQAETVLEAISRDAHDCIRRLYPEEMGQEGPIESANAALPDGFHAGAVDIRCDREGYIQVIDGDRLLEFARSSDLLLHAVRIPGDFICSGDTIVRAWPAHRASDSVIRGIRRSFTLGRHRTYLYDVEFAFEQLALVAVRALSPGINDPYTAMAALDRISAALTSMGRRRIPSPVRYDRDGQMRLVSEMVEAGRVVGAAFSPILEFGRNHTQVVSRLVDTIYETALRIENRDMKKALRAQLAEVERVALEGLPPTAARQGIESRLAETRQSLERAA